MTWKGWEDFNPLTGAKMSPAAQSLEKARAPRKYRNEPTMRGTFRFDSKREADRFDVLTDDVARGRITHFGLQPQFDLHATSPDGVKVTVGRYIADFTYRRNGVTVFEDAKGVRTELYKWKRKHAEIEYGVQIVEI